VFISSQNIDKFLKLLDFTPSWTFAIKEVKSAAD